MKYSVLFLMGSIFVQNYGIAGDFRLAQAAAGARPLNLRGSTYTPGGEPEPLMVWLPIEKINKIGMVTAIEDALVCFEGGPKSIKHAAIYVISIQSVAIILKSA